MTLDLYASKLAACLHEAEVTDCNGNRLADGLELFCKLLKDAKYAGRRIFIVGNGGSSAIASHAAIDLTKNAHIPVLAFNDVAAITCLSNDYSYEEVFSKQLEFHGNAGDVVIAISSSGQSLNIVNAALFANSKFMTVVTFTGFMPDNRLRGRGKYNFYVPSFRYGMVELAHMTILHAIIDMLVAELEAIRAE